MKNNKDEGCFCQKCKHKKILYRYLKNKYCFFCLEKTPNEFRVFCETGYFAIGTRSSIRMRHKRKGFGKFLSDLKAKHTADVALSYYHFAYHQMLSLGDAYTAFFKIRDPKQDEVMLHLRMSWSYAFGMYVLLRTAIEALSIMRKMIGDGTPLDKYYEENIKRLIDIANDIVKHPTFKHEVVSEACEPQALSMNGEIDVVVWSDSGEASKIQLDPMKDFMVVHDYYEYLGERLLGKS